MKKIFGKIKNGWDAYLEKTSWRNAEREELKEELGEYYKDVKEISKSSISRIKKTDLEKAILIQNLHIQRSLNQATDSLKIATWILVLATIVLAWISITDSPNSNYFWSNLEAGASLFLFVAIIIIILGIIWEVVKFLYRKLSPVKPYKP